MRPAVIGGIEDIMPDTGTAIAEGIIMAPGKATEQVIMPDSEMLTETLTIIEITVSEIQVHDPLLKM